MNSHAYVLAANARLQLGRTRRVQINEFKGKQLIDIREFYEKDEQMLPGRKVSSFTYALDFWPQQAVQTPARLD